MDHRALANICSQPQYWVRQLWLPGMHGDTVRTLGFVAASCIPISMLSVVAYLALYGLSILLEGVELSQGALRRPRAWGRYG